MLNQDSHVSDQELLLAADGELPGHRAAQVRAHLAACWNCRARMAEVEATIADFVRAQRQTLDPQLPPVAGPRALLSAQLSALASKCGASSPWRLFQFTPSARVAAVVCAALIVAAAGQFLLRYSTVPDANSTGTLFEPGAEPNHSLTPGATRRVTMRDVCAMAHEQVREKVSTSLRQEVLQEYGIVDTDADDYEIDYLVAPGLGGVEEIHNLWPEPYTSGTWNAYIKDDLEEYLHQLVCGGELDLSTAQRDISTDWIAAYKKYFHTDRPLSVHSRVDSPPPFEFGGSGPEELRAE
jgi:hypothetical protein